VAGFERRDEVGGVWTVSHDPTITSVSTNTKAQLSKFFVNPKYNTLRTCTALLTLRLDSLLGLPAQRWLYYPQVMRNCPLQVPMTDPLVDFPRHATAADLGQYYREYADHFGLRQRIVFNATITSITRDHQKEKWQLHVAGEDQPRAFDKVVYAIGTEVVPKYPRIDNLGEFKGTVIHGQAYKRFARI
jgi:dimethylaniline monooxygenase (N-oxide forming)